MAPGWACSWMRMSWDGYGPGMGMLLGWRWSQNGDGPAVRMLLRCGWSQNEDSPRMGMLLGWGCSWDEEVPGWDAPTLGMLPGEGVPLGCGCRPPRGPPPKAEMPCGRLAQACTGLGTTEAVALLQRGH